MNNIPRSEYPRPQFVREGWMNLNGVWQFEIDHGDSGRKRGLMEKEKLDSEILVPFCPESQLSGIGYTDFMRAVWYRRSFALPAEAKDKRVILHFGAVDYLTEVWINGKSVGTHKGGYTSFSFDITDALCEGENTLVLCAQLWAIVIDPDAAAADKTEASRLVRQIDQMRYSDYENCN